MKYSCECGLELQEHNTILIKDHMDLIFKNLKCKNCKSDEYAVTKKGSLMIVTHCKKCNVDSEHFWFTTVK